MDLIESNVELTCDRIDLDVNKFSLAKDYTHELRCVLILQKIFIFNSITNNC